MRNLLLGVLSLTLAACGTDYISVPVSYQKQPIKVPKCKPVVQYQGRSFKTGGIEIPIPQLGGTTKIGEVSLTPTTLNTLYREVAILDALRLQYCDARLAAAQVSLAEFQKVNQRMLDQEEKISLLAFSASQGEQQVKQTLTTVTNGPTAPAAKVDTQVVAALKPQVTELGAPVMTGSSASGAVSSAAPSLPPQVAAVLKSVPKAKLLRAARTRAPKKKKTAETTPHQHT